MPEPAVRLEDEDEYEPVLIAYHCSRCQFPAVYTGGRWQHAEPADAAFCNLVYGGNRA